MKLHDEVKKLEEQKKEIIDFMNEIDEQLRARKIKKKEHKKIVEEKYQGKHKEQLITEIDDMIRRLHDNYHEKQKKKLKYAAGVAAMLILLMLGIFSSNQIFSPTGMATGTRQTTEIINYDSVFEQSTEAALALESITGFRISGILEGTRAVIKLRIGSTEYLVGEITPISQESLITGMMTREEPPPYSIATDKPEYKLGETVEITITPEPDDKSLYISYNDEMRKLDEGTSTYLPAEAGEYDAIALIVMPDDILRIETAFTVTEAAIDESAAEATEADASELAAEPQEPVAEEPTPQEEPQETPTGYDFANICVDTCSLEEASNPTLIVELEEGSNLTITELIITRNKENTAPEQDKIIPDMTLIVGQEATIELDEHFSDADEDSLQYDLNEIPEINAAIIQSELSISSETPGIYTAYIYATDGDALVTSNTFTITITEDEPVIDDNQATNETGNETANETGTSQETAAQETTDPCSNPDINSRPTECFVGLEEQAFENLNVPLENNQRGIVGLFTRFGNLIIRGLLIQNASGNPSEDDFQIGFRETRGFTETSTITAWVDSETGNLHLKGTIYQNQETLNPPQYDVLVIRNKYGLVLGYFDQLRGDLYLRGNIVQLGVI